MRRVIVLAVGLSAAACACLASADRQARVDAQGVLRWCDGADEVALLGVNYYTPYTIDFAELSRLGLDHRQVIRDDVAHFRRLGMGCIRVHCFDREFSDAAATWSTTSTSSCSTRCSTSAGAAASTRC
jgi:hypothetical protein